MLAGGKVARQLRETIIIIIIIIIIIMSTLPLSERSMLYGRMERGETGQLDTQYYTN